MSSLTKKSLVCSTLIGVNFLASIILPIYFFYESLALVVLIIVAWKIYFDVDLKVSSILDKLKFLAIPLIFNLGALYLSTIFFQTFAKVIILLLVFAANYFLWIALRKVHNLSDRAAIFHRNILIVLSFVSVFLGSTTVFRLYMLLSTTSNTFIYQSLLVLLIFALFYIVSSFLTWENGAADDQIKLRPYNVVNSLLGAQVAWISSLWIVNYPVVGVSEKANLGGTPLPAILLTIIFYFLWGTIFHKLDGSLTKRVLTEYIFISFLFILVLMVTARWLPTL